MPEGHDTTIEVSNSMSFVLYTQILKQPVLEPASPGITLNHGPLCLNRDHIFPHIHRVIQKDSLEWTVGHPYMVNDRLYDLLKIQM